ncbi:DNA alkylation repair protein [uncultured Abiotrophia sp.]|uniref:DNA alkylation repair protein n=1 Tax=uncultured Abiotrophia sp. TaxID=316094 RepID=UPI0028D84EE6|nr:DNA alkylation repair protein [uncultured Abiotrophia sp.]
MQDYIKRLEAEFSLIEKGFKEEEKRAQADYASQDSDYIKQLAMQAYQSETYQVRMYAVFLMGYLSQQEDILDYLREQVCLDPNWRVQEVLAKAFDHYCKTTGYQAALPVIDDWLGHSQSNTRRAVTEGLRIWTSRPYFKDHPQEAIRRIACLKRDPSDYVRKSVGNALRDISRKFPDLIQAELATWTLDGKDIQQVHKLASKFLIA